MKPRLKLSAALDRGRKFHPEIPAEPTGYATAGTRYDSLLAAVLGAFPEHTTSQPGTITRTLAHVWPELWQRVLYFPRLSASVEATWGLKRKAVERMSLFMLITTLDRNFGNKPGYAKALFEFLKSNRL